MSLSATSVSASASTVDPTPMAQVQATIGNAMVGVTYFVAASTTNTGVASVNVGSLSSSAAPTANIVVNFKPPSSLSVGVYNDTVTVAACYDQACTRPIRGSPQLVSVQYTVTNPIPTMSLIQPSSASAGSGGFALTVYGTEFTAQSVVNWNGAARPTTYVSGTQLTAQIGAGDVAGSGTASVTVTNPGIATSSAASFTIDGAVLTSVAPNLIAAGGPTFILNLFGSGFASSSVAQWNGAARNTTFISATQLQAQIPSTDIAAVGAASITVSTPSATGGGSSGAVPVTIATLPSWPAATHAVAYQINPAHTGAVTFSSVTFPTAITWTVDFGATPSYALIADGTVFVTATDSTANSSLYALDLTTGGTKWGPVAIPGDTSPAYDNGVVFVSSAVGGGTGSVNAYDAATGTLLWSTPMSGFDPLSASAPTAMNGFVYVTGQNGTSALNESTGAVTWSQSSFGFAQSSPAVSASGVYVDPGCVVYAYDPTTGTPLWSAQPACTRGFGSTPFLVGNSLFAPMNATYGGSILDASTGTSTGTYSAGVPPVFDAQTGYFVQPNQQGPTGALQAITLSSNAVKWTFAGESAVCAAAVISQYVIAAGCTGKLYGIDSATGQQVWLATPGAPSVWNFTGELPLPAMAAGDGMLVINSGTKLVAYTLATSP